MNDDLRTLLTEQLSNEKISPDGKIYRKIRQHCLKPLAAARWWACLTENKQYEIKRLLGKDDFTAAFDALLNIPDLWRDGMRLGVTKDVMGLTSDTMTLFHQLKKGEIFGAFKRDRRMEICRVL